MNGTILIQYVEAVHTQLTKPSPTLVDQSNEYWDEIFSRDFLFNRTTMLIHKLKGIVKSDLVKFCEQYLFNVTTRRRFSIHVVGDPPLPPSTPSFQQDVINDGEILSFKSQSKLYPIMPSIVFDVDPPMYTHASSPGTTLTTPDIADNFRISGLMIGIGVSIFVLLCVIVIVIVYSGKFKFGPTIQEDPEPDGDLSEDFFYDDDNDNNDQNLLSETMRNYNDGEDDQPKHALVYSDDDI